MPCWPRLSGATATPCGSAPRGGRGGFGLCAAGGASGSACLRGVTKPRHDHIHERVEAGNVERLDQGDADAAELVDAVDEADDLQGAEAEAGQRTRAQRL